MQAPGFDNYPLLKCIQANVSGEKMHRPNIQTAITGTQNRRILSGSLLSRPAAKKNAKNETARIQNQGEKRLSTKPPAIAAKPVALELLILRKAKTSPGPSKATKIAATVLRTPRRIVTDLLPESLSSKLRFRSVHNRAVSSCASIKHRDELIGSVVCSSQLHRAQTICSNSVA